VNELHVVVIVSQVPENVCKQSRKTVKYIVTVHLCVLGIKTIFSNDLQHTYVMSVVSVTLNKNSPFSPPRRHLTDALESIWTCFNI